MAEQFGRKPRFRWRLRCQFYASLAERGWRDMSAPLTTRAPAVLLALATVVGVPIISAIALWQLTGTPWWRGLGLVVVAVCAGTLLPRMGSTKGTLN